MHTRFQFPGAVPLLLILAIGAGGPMRIATAAPPTPATPAGPVELRTALSHSSYGATGPGSLLLKIDYAAAAGPPSTRPPLNIALVIDRSSSMTEDKKLAYALEAAREVIRNLSERDIVSLIAFNERVTVLSPAGRAVNDRFLLHRLDEISPEGYTDISAGLLEGIGQIESKSAAGQIKQVLFLTDGNANRGVTDAGSLTKIVGKNQARGIRVSTLGVGSSYNEKLLAELARAGGGRYTYVRSAEQLPTAFLEELHGALVVVAQNVRLETSVKGGTLSQVLGDRADQPATTRTIELGSLRAGEHGAILLQIAPAEIREGGGVEIATALVFDDPQTGERMRRTSASVAVFAPAWTPQTSGENAEVVLYGRVLEIVRRAQEGAEGFDLERYKQTRAQFDQAYGPAHQLALTTRNQDLLNQLFLLKHFMEELEAMRAQGALHGHEEVRQRFQKESDYARYLLLHHRGPAVTASPRP